MLNFLTIVLICLILIFLVIFKGKKILNTFNQKKLYSLNEANNEKKLIISASNNNLHYQNYSNKYSEFYKRNLRVEMFKLFKGNTADKLKALEIAEELGDKSTLPILRKGLKDMNLKIVEISANLIRKFK